MNVRLALRLERRASRILKNYAGPHDSCTWRRKGNTEGLRFERIGD